MFFATFEVAHIVLGDKGYDSDKLREKINQAGGIAQILEIT